MVVTHRKESKTQNADADQPMDESEQQEVCERLEREATSSASMWSRVFGLASCSGACYFLLASAAQVSSL